MTAEVVSLTIYQPWASYTIDPIHNGKPMTKMAQIRMCGNSVCPPLSEALVRANFAAEIGTKGAEIA